METVLQIAVRENVTAIVVGKSGPRRWYEIGRKTLVDRLIDRSGFIHVYVIQGREEEEKVSCHHYGSTAAAGRLAPVCRGAGGSCHYYWALLCFPRSAGAGQYILTVFAAGIVDSSLVGQKYGLCNSALFVF